MVGHLKCLLVTVLLGMCCSQAAAQGSSRRTGSGRGAGRGSTEFLNGISFNIDSLLEDLDILPAASRRQDRGDIRFAGADRAMRNNDQEMNFRSVFSRSTGNEFIDSDNVSDAAMTAVQQLEVLVDRTGIVTAESFDADGNPIDPGVVELSSQRINNCPYDRANSLPCSDLFKEPTGRCTNVMDGKKTWGMAGTPYGRVLPAEYEDGIGARRITEFDSGEALKSPREISTVVTTNDIILNFDGFNAQIMQWGQYIAHEFTHLAETETAAACCPDQIFTSRNGTGVPTSAQRAQIREEIRRDRGDVCMQIEIDNDPEHNGYVCMAQTRSKPAPLHDCSIGPRQQMNSISHVFDASVVYGSSKADQDALRSFNGGKMKTQVVNGAVLPPQDLENCPAAKKSVNRCPFRGGDTRINTTPNLMSTHTVTIVKHNQLAEKLSVINPKWDDERIFQEARRIITAIEANIHYYEYLPIIMGNTVIKEYRLDSYDGFNASVNPSVVSEMAHAAMRFGHATVDGFFTAVKDVGPPDFVDLRPNFFNSDFVYDGGIKQCIKGLLKDVPWIVDRNFPTQMRDFLFDSKRDIISLNINRGRDHGLQSYVDYRRHYGLSVPLSFEDLSTTHTKVAVDALKKVYTSVNDIELYPAGVTENHVEGGLIGELFANILGDGFSRLLRGDRLWFEGPNSGLTTAQIKAIRGYKYNQLLCEGAGLTNISENAFVIPGFFGVSEISCSSLPELDLSLWKEQVPAAPQCEWQIVSTSPCCRGEMEITRKCMGDSGCECTGSEKISTDCECSGYACYRNIVGRCKHKWGSWL